MHPHLLLYSTDPNITRAQLKAQSQPKNKLFWEEKVQYNFEKIQKEFDKLQVSWVIQWEENFHFKLATIKPQPYLMYYKWDIKLLDLPLLAIVGPRKISPYAEKVIHTLFKDLPKYKLTIISWGATGVDQLAHNLALQHNIPTIVALGMGIGNALQWTKRNFLKKVVDKWGLLLSEYKLYEPSSNYSFPERNRIIAGLSECIFIPEAQTNSWSLITANFANKMHKPIYGTPNTIFEKNSQGLHEYIQDKKITPLFDLELMLSTHFTLQKNTASSHKPLPTIDLTTKEKLVIQHLSESQQCSLDKLSKFTQIPTHLLLWLITNLQLKDLIHQSHPGQYSLK